MNKECKSCIFCNKECASESKKYRFISIIWRLCFQCRNGNSYSYIIEKENEKNMSIDTIDSMYSYIYNNPKKEGLENIYTYIGSDFDGPFEFLDLEKKYLW